VTGPLQAKPPKTRPAQTEPSRADRWIRRFAPAPDAPTTLVCFPHAGGSASFYAPLARTLAPDLDVLTLNYPGRQARRAEPVVDDIAQLADRIAEVLPPFISDRTYAFFGHSMGAVVAFEVACRLEHAQGTSPAMLWASARRAPSIPDGTSVHLLDDDSLVAVMKRLSGTPATLFDEEELIRWALPAVRGDYRAIETYRCVPGATVSCPISVLVGDGDPITSVEQAAAWQRHTAGEFALCVLPGGHFYLADHGELVVARIRAQLSSKTPALLV
jgi:surfactin synthase thioesterase subunit